MKRTLAVQAINKVGGRILVYGWVNSIRHHGKVNFVDLRDRSGVIQIVGKEELLDLGREDVVQVIGKVVKRDKGAVNPDLATGEVEIQVDSVEVLSKADAPPIDVQNDGYRINEESRLKYRYLDLRRPRLQKNIRLRAEIAQGFRRELNKLDFTEIETPLLTKSTPEGARDFLVPSRLQPGNFYALPQSPQQYKQLLMVAGFERYFQLARCLRDEDLRANRSNEFTQVDIEISFMDRDEILQLVEEVIINVYQGLGFEFKQIPFPRIKYQDALKKYGDDKFDLRTEEEEKKGILSFAWVVDFPLFEKTETRDLNPMHHPFTAPHPDDLDLLDKNPEEVRSWQYDLVCNGQEVGGGSVRITNPEIQTKIFQILGHSRDEIEEKFGHLLKAFGYGVPPHGGIALGLSRLVMVAAGEKSLKETVAFPPLASGRTAVMDAPSQVSSQQLKELGIQLHPDLQKDES